MGTISKIKLLVQPLLVNEKPRIFLVLYIVCHLKFDLNKSKTSKIKVAVFIQVDK